MITEAEHRRYKKKNGSEMEKTTKLDVAYEEQSRKKNERQGGEGE